MTVKRRSKPFVHNLFSPDSHDNGPMASPFNYARNGVKFTDTHKIEDTLKQQGVNGRVNTKNNRIKLAMLKIILV